MMESPPKAASLGRFHDTFIASGIRGPKNLRFQGTQPVGSTLNQDPNPRIYISPSSQVASVTAFPLVGIQDLLKAAHLFKANPHFRLCAAAALT